MSIQHTECLMFLPYFLLVPSKTRCIQVNLMWIFMFLVHGIRREEYRLSSAQILSSWLVSILNSWWSVNWLHILCDKCKRRNSVELLQCPVMKDQWDCVLDVLEELGDKEFRVLTSSTILKSFLDTSVSCHLTLPHVTRSMLRVLKFVPKIIFQSPEFNRSIFFSK